MNAPKVTDLDYINFLLVAQRVVSCTEAIWKQSFLEAALECMVGKLTMELEIAKKASR